MLKEKIIEMTFMRGFNELQKCTFWIERKSRDLLIEANPQFRSGRGKIIWELSQIITGFESLASPLVYLIWFLHLEINLDLN